MTIFQKWAEVEPKLNELIRGFNQAAANKDYADMGRKKDRFKACYGDFLQVLRLESKEDQSVFKEKMDTYLDKLKKMSDAVKEGPEEKNDIESSLADAIVREKPNVCWDDIAGLDNAKNTLKEAVLLPIRFPEMFVGGRKPWKGILLYGPPGTGKTFLAKACAREMDEAVFFSVSSSDIMSKYVGESEKIVKKLFEMARRESSSIIFIDEVDSIAGARKEGENDASRHVKTEFLVQTEGVAAEKNRLLVLGATNLPWEIDAAMRRRFQRRIYIPLPEEETRFRLLKKLVGTTPNVLTEDELRDLARRTEG